MAIVILVIRFQPMTNTIFETSSRIHKKFFAGNQNWNPLINSCSALKKKKRFKEMVQENNDDQLNFEPRTFFQSQLTEPLAEPSICSL